VSPFYPLKFGSSALAGAFLPERREENNETFVSLSFVGSVVCLDC
jgi:hypothetical protein